MPRGECIMLANLTWPEASSALNGAVVLLPVGAIEAHGPHLPLDTDVIIARETARRTCRRISGPAVVLPEISYGVSFVGACFPGTTPAPPDALTRMINEILVTSLDAGAIAAIIVNAHLEPAHIQALADAAKRAANATMKPVAFPDIRQERWARRLSTEFLAGMRHAGAYETSLVLAAKPEAVRREFLPGLEPVMIDLPAALRAGAHVRRCRKLPGLLWQSPRSIGTRRGASFRRVGADHARRTRRSRAGSRNAGTVTFRRFH